MYKNIFDAIRHNDKNAVSQFLKTGINLHDIEAESKCTPSNLAAKFGLDELLEMLLDYEEKIDAETKLGLFPASHGQKRFYFLNEILEDPSVYHEHSILEFKGKFDTTIFSKVLACLMQRHESLRTQFTLNQEGEVQQHILKNLDVSAVLTECNDNEALNIDEFIIRERDFLRHNFILDAAPLWRVKLFYQSPDRSLAFFVFHHIIIDASSVSLIFKEMFSLYDAIVNNQFNTFIEKLPPSFQVRQYCQWENQWHNSEEYQTQLGYWHKRLEGYESQIELLNDIQNTSVNSTTQDNGHSLIFQIGEDYHQKMLMLSKQAKVTPFTAYLAAYYILLFQHTQQTDIVVGTPFANRILKHSDSAVGCFINTLPVRCQLDVNKSFLENLKSLNAGLQSDLSKGQVAYDEILKQCMFEKDSHADRLIQTFFTYQLGLDLSIDLKNYHLPFTAEGKNVEHNPPGTTHYPISIELIQGDGKKYLLFNYRKDLYSQAFINNLFVRYCRILHIVAENPNIILQEIDLLTEAESHQQLVTWNQTQHAYSQAMLHQLFEAQVEKSPNAVALVFEDQEITYAELNAQANQIAHYLRQQNVNVNELVAIVMEKGWEQVVAAIGIVKAGAAYLPINADLAVNRIAQLLLQGEARFVLTQRKHVEAIDWPENVTYAAVDHQDHWQAFSRENVVSINTIDHLAYVIFTSGSTGIPKGVMIDHRGAVNTIQDMNTRFQVTSNDVVLGLSALNFDLSVYDIFGVLGAGGRLVLPSEADRKDPLAWLALMERYQVTLWNSVPALMKMLVEYRAVGLTRTQIDACQKIRIVWLSGDWIPLDLPKKILDVCGTDTQLISLGGATEASIWSIFYPIESVDPSWRSVPYGRPMWNQQFYILNEHQRLLPVGVLGELYIGGIGVAKGYWKDEERTKKSFINHPTLGCLYRTGDMGRYNENGVIEFMGRLDNQVKVRGYRIELGEIEAQLLKQPHIVNAVVLVKAMVDNDKKLVAYLVSPSVSINNDAAKESHIQSLRTTLVTLLPEYMVPAHFILLDKIPLSANGKIDRKALLALDIESSEVYCAPQNPLEVQIGEVWQEILNRESISVEEDFFKLGGDSILSIQVVAKLRKKNIDCTVKQVFEYRTIRRLAEFLGSHTNIIRLDAEQGILQGSFEFLPIQKYFFASRFTQQNHWNQAFLIRVSALDITKLQSILLPLINHHDALRLHFSEAGQRYQEKIKLPEVKYFNVQGFQEQAIHQALTAWQSTFNIEKGPLWQIGYIDGYADGEARIYFALHHLIVDAVSWRILAEDIKTLYEGGHLPEKTSSYRQWVQAVSGYAKNNSDEVKYWQSVVQDQQLMLNDITSEAKIYSVQINQALTRQLLHTSSRAFHTEINDLLLTALAYALNQWSGSTVHHITLEGHGRESIADNIDLSRTVGWFTTMFPVRLEVKDTIADSIKHIKECLHSIPNKGLGYSTLKYCIYHSELKNHELPRIRFNYLGQFDTIKNAAWQIDPSNTGLNVNPENEDPNILNINGWVSQGKLQLQIASRCDAVSSLRFVSALQRNLEAITEYCMQQVTFSKEVYTPSDFPHVKLSSQELDYLQNRYAIQAIYPANSLQQGFIYHAVTQPQDDAYRVQMLFDYAEPLSMTHYKKAWELVMQTYPILRTCFHWDNEIIQIVNKTGNLIWQEHDISAESDKEAALGKIKRQDREQAFDLSRPELLRIHVIKHSANHYTVIKSEHHAIGDGWSNQVILKKVHAYYADLIRNKKITVTEDRTYLIAQEYYIKHRDKAYQYWQEQLALVESSNDLTVFFTEKTNLNNIKQVTMPKVASVILEQENYAALQNLVHKEGLTLNILIQYAWHKLIQVYTRDKLTIVGTTVSGRELPLADIANTAGLFINTLPLVINWQEEHTVLEQLKLLHQRLAELSSYSYVDLVKLQRSGQRLFHSLFAFENYPLSQEKSIKIEFRESVEKIDYPLGLVVYEAKNGLHLKLNYAGEYIEHANAMQLLKQLQIILTEIPQKLHAAHYNIRLFDTQEYQLQMQTWNQTKHNYPPATLHQLFEEQVLKTPHQTALVYENQAMTYLELNVRANLVADYLIKAREKDIGSKHDMLVGIGVERSLEMMIGILAILKAGCAYVPFDPNHPNERIRYMLSNTKISMLLTQKHLLPIWNNAFNNLPHDYAVNAVNLDDQLVFSDYSRKNPDNDTQPSDLAYVIYTSGSTGQPKGVMIEHHSAINLIICLAQQVYKINQDTYKVAAFAPYIFDVSVAEFFVTLLYGGELHLLSETVRNEVSALSEYLQKKEIHYAFLPPSMLTILPKTEYKNLQGILTGIERLDENTGQYWSANYPVHNYYGPTETTICSTGGRIYPTFMNTIGKSLFNTQLYVLDEHQQLLPVGAIGELYIGGVGLARGYLNKETLTAERFILNRFNDNDVPVRLYRTGDLVRYLPDGNIEYIGRTDNQIKLRGFRIELEEVEAQLLKQPPIANAAVVVNGEGQAKQLVAYIVSNQAINQQEIVAYIHVIKETLSAFLPGYMIPAHIVVLEEMPLNANGKIDRKALASLSIDVASKNYYVAPFTTIEKQLAAVWAKVLHLPIEQVGVEDHFFECGGHSIAAMQFISQVNKQFALEITMGQFYKDPRIAKIAASLKDNADMLDACFIPIALNSTKPALFLIHPLFSVTTVYQKLSPSLASHFSIYGINYPGLMQEEMTYFSSLSDLAAEYIQKIRKNFSQASYHLGGWSAGGNIALEMTQQLQAAGEEVQTLLLFDTAYIVYRELFGRTYMTLFAQSLLQRLNITFAADDHLVQKIIKVATHLEYLLVHQQPQRISPIKRLMLIKCQGALVNLASQYLANLDWRGKDMLNGLRYYLSEGQSVHVQAISCDHTEIFYESHISTLNKLVTVLLQERQADAYIIGHERVHVIIAENKNALYFQQGFSAEMGNYHHIVNNSLEVFDEESLDPLNFTQQSQKLLAEMVRRQKLHTLSVKKILSTLPHNYEFFQQTMQLLFNAAPRYIFKPLFSVTQKLLILRLVSSQSTTLINAYMFDEAYLEIILKITQDLIFPANNYLTIALARNEHFRVGEAFDAAFWISLSMMSTIIIYASLTQRLGHLAEQGSDFRNAWSLLALCHMIGGIPTLINLSLEKFYFSINQHSTPAWGSFSEALVSIIMTSLFWGGGSLNGATLGLALSFGSMAKLTWYLYDLHSKNYLTMYHMFQHFPYRHMCRYVQDSLSYISISLSSLSYILIASILAAVLSGESLAAYFVAKGCLDMITLPTTIITSASGNILKQLIGATVYPYALGSNIISLEISVLIASIFATALLSVNGESLANLFMDSDVIATDSKTSFFESVKEDSYYFVMLGIFNAIRTPIAEYLRHYYAFIELQKIFWICDIIFTFTIIATMVLKDVIDPVNLMCGYFAPYLLATLWTIKEWLRLSDFYCHPESVKSAGKVRSFCELINPCRNVPRPLVTESEDETYNIPLLTQNFYSIFSSAETSSAGEKKAPERRF